MPFERSAGAVVFCKGPQGPSSSAKATEDIEFLLLQYKRDGREWWDYVKGHREAGETEIETTLRELKEETGLTDVEVVPGFKTWIKFFFKENGRTVAKIVDFYLVEAKTKEVKLSFEHAGYDWLSYEQALERLMYKNAKEVLKKANNFLKRET